MTRTVPEKTKKPRVWTIAQNEIARGLIRRAEKEQNLKPLISIKKDVDHQAGNKLLHGKMAAMV